LLIAISTVDGWNIDWAAAGATVPVQQIRAISREKRSDRNNEKLDSSMAVN
jgi:hypothetical protein